MNQNFIFAIGFLAQILFSARQLTQWISSERAGKILSPILFWQLSIFASSLLIIYGILRNDPAIIFGQFITYGVYIRNLYFFGFWKKIPRLPRFLAYAFPLLAVGMLLVGQTHNLQTIFSNDDIPTTLLIWGITGQIVFTFRFIYQWFYSEKRKQSILPLGFWIISLTGSLMVLSYAIIRKDPVLFVGQAFGLIVYSRNIILDLRQKKSDEADDYASN
ncbi:MAG: lauroyl acyltransferase [Desulfotalea sp.]|nr:MAG: lauroyl acyltransferase [Desulfotalea sp.]